MRKVVEVIKFDKTINEQDKISNLICKDYKIQIICKLRAVNKKIEI